MIKNSSATTQYSFKKIGAVILLIIFISTSFPSSVSASDGGGAYANMALQAAWKAMDAAVAKFRKQLLDTVVNQLIAWINDDKKPAFVSDLPKMLKETADTAGMLTVQEKLGKDFVAGLCQSGWALSIKAVLAKMPTFGEKAQCSFKDVTNNYYDFMNNFTRGGWSNWITISESQNNPYMVYMTALDEKLTSQVSKQAEKIEDHSVGGGFLSDKVCNTITHYASQEDADQNNISTMMDLTYSEDDIRGLAIKAMQAAEPYHQYKCVTWETRSPGKIMADAANESLFKDVKWLQNNPEWTSYVVAIGDAMVNRMTKEGIKAIKSYDIKGGDVASMADITPPVTSATIIDPWHIALSSNKPGKTAYTLDGTDPAFYSTSMLEYTGYPLAIVSSTNNDLKSKSISSVKWRSLDGNSNVEQTRTFDFVNPITGVKFTTPFDLAAIKAYILTQKIDIPQKIQTKLYKLVTDSEVNLTALATSTSIPSNLITSLQDYIAIEDFRIKAAKPTVIHTADLLLLRALVASSTEQTITQFIARTNLSSYTSVLEDMHTEALTTQTARADLKALIADIKTNAETGFPNITLITLAEMLTPIPEFKVILDEVNAIIAERGLIKLDQYKDNTEAWKDGWDDTKDYTFIAAVDPYSFVLLSNNPNSTINFRMDNAHHGTSDAPYLQKVTLPDKSEYSVYWGTGNDAPTAHNSIKFTPPFPNADLPSLVDLVPPTASIAGTDPLTPDPSGYVILDPSNSIDADKPAKQTNGGITGYEWIFTYVGTFRWASFDKNRDGTFDLTDCLPIGTFCDISYNDPNTKTTLSIPGFVNLQVIDPDVGKIKVKFSTATTTSEIRTIKLRVTDNEGLWTEKTVTVNLPSS